MVGNIVALALAGTVAAVVLSTRKDPPNPNCATNHKRLADRFEPMTVDQILAEYASPEAAHIGLSQMVNKAIHDGCTDAANRLQAKVIEVVTRPRTAGW